MGPAVRTVDSTDEVLEHTRRYPSEHTEAIYTRSLVSTNHFRAELGSAAIVINASVRLMDGGRVGLGTGIGIPTQKFHARGLMRSSELTTSIQIIEGEGAIRP